MQVLQTARKKNNQETISKFNDKKRHGKVGLYPLQEYKSHVGVEKTPMKKLCPFRPKDCIIMFSKRQGDILSVNQKNKYIQFIFYFFLEVAILDLLIWANMLFNYLENLCRNIIHFYFNSHFHEITKMHNQHSTFTFQWSNSLYIHLLPKINSSALG